MSFFKNKKFHFFKIEVAIVLTGIVLILIGGILDETDKNTQDSNVVFEAPKEAVSDQFSVDYAKKYERQIERILRGISGVKSVKAAVYVSSEGERVIATNDKWDNSVVSEKEGDKSAEERRDVSENAVVVIKDAQGNETAVVVSEKAPEIVGIAVCVEGDLSKTLEEKILRTLMSLYGLPASKISIMG